MRPSTGLTLALACGLALLAGPLPAAAQSTGYVTGFPGKDPAADDEIGWGPAYRPETSFSQPGTPPTPGDFAGAAYRARTGRGPYDAVQGPGPARPIGYGIRDEREGPFVRPARRQRAAGSRAGHRGAQALHRPPKRQALR
ncbi:hypothetical protein [Methylobacterium nigriterrae]|uniref:hypothetical protein n=1 Tax=Methylobacterium nigriterrae TaxID=3127512 RepID=UPI00301411E5